MKATRSTMIQFGMVSIPVKLFKITDDRPLAKDIHQVHGACGTRIKAPKWCPRCDKAVEAAELIRGYFYDKENYVPLYEEDMDRLPLSSLKAIQIDAFIPPIEDPRWFNGAIYAMAPDEIGVKAFVLFAQAMAKLDLWGVAKMATRDKEQLIAIRPSGDGVLFVQTLHWATELRDYSELIPFATPTEKEMGMAEALILAMGTKDPEAKLEEFQDEYNIALKDMIAAKLEGRELVAVPSTRKMVEGDLEQQLLASLQAMAQPEAK